MKKFFALLLTIVMIASLAVPSFAGFGGKSEYPVVFLFGNGADIYDEDGNMVYDFHYETDALVNDIVEICFPHLLTGMATGDYTAYYDALYTKMAEVYGNAKLDENGNAMAGTNVHPSLLASNDRQSHRGWQSTYAMHEYTFWYDWRIDPMELADRLNDYINTTLESSGKDKVSLYGRCMGGTPIIAYIAKYGSDKLDTVCLDAVVTNGSELIGDVFTGNIALDTDALLRFANGYWKDDIVNGLGDELLYNVIFSMLRLLNSMGASDEALQAFMDTIYGTVGEGFISSYMRASYATWPSYWTMVKADEFEQAKTVIFGEEGGELRQTYAGLIEKLDYYHDNVTSRIPEILKAAKENDTKFCIISKYGSQLYPYVASYEKISDQWLSVENSSMGATAAKINEALPEEYIAQREAEGLGRYISPDKQIDASTCALPDSTWFVKGLNHDQWLECTEALAYAVCSNDITDVNSDAEHPQFMCYDKENDTLVPLTAENQDCNDFTGTDTGSTENMSKKERIIVKLRATFSFVASIFRFISNLFKK